MLVLRRYIVTIRIVHSTQLFEIPDSFADSWIVGLCWAMVGWLSAQALAGAQLGVFSPVQVAAD
jgi:hypothetical protein